VVASFRSSALATERGLQAIELARRHGRSGEPLVAIAYPMLAGSFIWQGELEEAERWLVEGERALQSEVDPVTAMLFHLVRGFLEIARGRVEAALGALRAADRLPGRLLIAAHPPVLDGSAPGSHQVWQIAAFLLEASARDALAEREGAGRALERGPDLAEPDGLLFPFLLHLVPELLERHARQRTAHPALTRQHCEHLPEPLSQAEARVLRFLPTSLSAPEIARELYVSVNTVRTHMRHLYDKLGAHRRLEAIDRARALGLLAPVPQRALRRPSASGASGRPGRFCGHTQE
jgi:LuxR family maltose regulon positive regulatory protein